VKVINQVPNRISISGHTDQTPYVSKNGYSNWELSADRANAARRELVRAGMPDTKIGRVVGLSSSALFDKKNPFNPINRRISIIVMNKATEEAVSHGEGGPALSRSAAQPATSSTNSEKTSTASATKLAADKKKRAAEQAKKPAKKPSIADAD